jgi:hypothetical protein
LGYDITSIQSIAAWVNGGFGNQAFKVEVKLIGASDTHLGDGGLSAAGTEWHRRDESHLD